MKYYETTNDEYLNKVNEINLHPEMQIILDKMNTDKHINTIFYGPSGVGKYKFTIEFIRSICHSKNLNQNVFEVNNPENPALIDDIRELISKIKLTNSSTLIEKTFFLVHQMENLNINCINALLKTIEEPPENTVIIIFTNNLRNIPKTILSRCIKLKFKVNDSEDFNEIRAINEENFLMSNYNPKILNLLNDKRVKL